jgi:HlyD family secretion protein
VQIAPEVAGRIVELTAKEGDQVKAGQPVFRLDDADAAAAVAQARAEVARAEAELRNRQEGQRPPELQVIEAQIAEADASLQSAQKNFERQMELFRRRVSSEAQLDRAREALEVAKARVETVRRQKQVAALPARTAEIEAAELAVKSAQARLSQAETRLATYRVIAPAAGLVDDVYYQPGEVVTPGAIVMSLLPPDRRKVIFFVPEPARAGLRVGSAVSVSCDGCPAGLSAQLTRLASEAEYTPPVIFSRETRDKLVFRAEARLESGAPPLPLGQPVDVAPAGGAGR